MTRYRLYAGLGGGFGGANYHSTDFFLTEEEAEEEAYRIACDEYESFSGMHGLFNSEEFIEELKESGEYEDLTEDELEASISEAENEDRENWIEYYVVKETDDNKNDDY